MKFNEISEAIEEIKKGKMVIVLDDEDRENEGDLVMAADLITEEDVNFMAKYGRGLICTPLTEERAKELNLPYMVKENESGHQTAFTVSIDAKNGGTGISATDRALTIKLLSSLHTKEDDLVRPGHIFPLIAKKGGVLTRPGHTEAAVDLAIMAGRYPVGVICEILNDDGTMARRDDLFKMAEEWNLKIITIKDMIAYKKKQLIKTHLPTKHGDFEIQLFNHDGKEHIALVKDNPQSHQIPLVRIHSECITGDLFGSLRCDCGEQYQASIDLIKKAEKGALIYLRQEGRGIGLENKIKAYQLQDQGLDTYEANHQLGFDSDLRKYDIAVEVLNSLGWNEINLITNNPNKIKQLNDAQINIKERISVSTPSNPNNQSYLLAKKNKMGHFLDIQGESYATNN